MPANKQVIGNAKAAALLAGTQPRKEWETYYKL
ncbi:hypothetical protein FHS83_000142 [Rhizomicrobium palustre]|uniref:Uncharacterized protein n=1 Tax=Rhizomicrobium palustre TaxID=189966 RepID=A0A846MTR0_9PROT|nr:hypothetical protein [Rhizomicrobium palustre]